MNRQVLRKIAILFLTFSASQVKAGEVKSPSNLRVAEVDYMSLNIRWDADTEFEDTIVMQWKKPGNNNWQYRLTFPHTADVYHDLGLTPNSEYQYRLKVVKPNGDESAWTSVKGKTNRNPYTKVFNVKNYGAVGNGKTNDTAAIQKAIDAAKKEGGGIIYIPQGTYVVMPRSSKPKGQVVIFMLTSNLTIRGDGPNKSTISFMMPGFKSPESNWLITEKGDLMRGFVFETKGELKVENATRNVVIENIQIKGNARPTGATEWWTNQQKQQGWDISHKGLFIGVGTENLYFKNTIWSGFRGEIIFGGGLRPRKFKIIDSDFYGSNGSAISTSTDFECDNIRVWDAANACVESVYFTNQFSHMKGIYLNSYFEPQAKMLLPGTSNPLYKKEGGLWCIFGPNDVGSYIVIENNEFKNSLNGNLYLGGAQNNVYIANNRFSNPGHLGFIYFQIQDKYLLSRQAENVIIKDNYFNANKAKNGVLINATNWNNSSFKDILIANNTFELTSGNNWVFLRDAHVDLATRKNFVIRNNRVIEKGGTLKMIAQDLKTSKKPLWVHNSFPRHDNSTVGREQSFMESSLPSVVDIYPHSPSHHIHNIKIGKRQTFRIPAGSEYFPDGFETRIYKSHAGGTALFKKSDASNRLPYDIELKYKDGATLKVKDKKIYLKEHNNRKALEFGYNNYCILDDSSSGSTYTFPLIYENNKSKLFHLYIHGSGIRVNSSEHLKLTSNIAGGSNVSLEIILSKLANGSLIEVDRYQCNRQLVLKSN